MFVFTDSEREVCLNYELIKKRFALAVHKPKDETTKAELPGNLVGDRSLPYNTLSTEEEAEKRTRIENWSAGQANYVEYLKENKTNFDELDNWDPCKEHYDSLRNSYGFNQESYETHMFGYGSLLDTILL